MHALMYACMHAGAYGQVWKCLDKETGKMVAMKRFKEVCERASG